MFQKPTHFLAVWTALAAPPPLPGYVEEMGAPADRQKGGGDQ